MNGATRIFLVLLRFAIGWHFLIEGLEKLDSHHHWFHPETRDSKPWSSAAYLKGSTGPLAPWFRGQLGDPDVAALKRLSFPPPRQEDAARLDVLLDRAIKGESLAKKGVHEGLPAALAKDWKDYFAHFKTFFSVGDEKAFQPEHLRLLAVAPPAPFPAGMPWQGLAQVGRLEQPDKLQLELAEYEFGLAETDARAWLTSGKRQVERSFSNVKEKVSESTPQRIQRYARKLRELRTNESAGLPAFGRDIWKTKLTTLRSEIATLRTELLSDLNRILQARLEFVYQARLTPAQRARGPLPPVPTGEPEPTSRVWWLDQLTMWGLTAVGVCLLLGLCTRTACVGGAGFLLLFYLAMPALPWLPANPRAEGHYLLVNKNLIEMLALLALATTQSGRWAGLDGLLHFFNPFRLRKRPRPGNKNTWGGPAARGTASPHPETFGHAAAPPASPSPVKEPSHGP